MLDTLGTQNKHLFSNPSFDTAKRFAYVFYLYLYRSIYFALDES